MEHKRADTDSFRVGFRLSKKLFYRKRKKSRDGKQIKKKT